MWTCLLYVICAVFLKGGCFHPPLPLEIPRICEGNISLKIKVKQVPAEVEDQLRNQKEENASPLNPSGRAESFPAEYHPGVPSSHIHKNII